MNRTGRLDPLEVFGLRPFGKAARETLLTLRGDASTPPSRFDVSSLRMLDPRVSFPLWLGRRRADGLIPIYNLFNHRQTDPALGWSVRVTQVEDFRGGTLTYDSHNGTDFAVPVGTTVVAAAPGRVLRVSSEMNRGGLKVFIDHGRGLVTTSNHLGRALVAVGDVVDRGTPVALSGASGIDCLAFFPFSCPHVHFNVWLNGEPVDPFARPGEVSLWRGEGGMPVPDDGAGRDATADPTAWDHDAVARSIETCLHAGARAELAALTEPDVRALAVMFQRNYYPTRFPERPNLYREAHPRAPFLDLPFERGAFGGVTFIERG
ncbi:M23 family metallopeptidase [Myxococcota bacterium]|nr:M23 family metallopeptidase [Myxococcota bacterium]